MQINKTKIDEALIEEVKQDIVSRDNSSVDVSFLEALARIENSIEYFEVTMARDLKRYFVQQDENSRGFVKGHYYFAKYLRDKILEIRKGSLQK